MVWLYVAAVSLFGGVACTFFAWAVIAAVHGFQTANDAAAWETVATTVAALSALHLVAIVASAYLF